MRSRVPVAPFVVPVQTVQETTQPLEEAVAVASETSIPAVEAQLVAKHDDDLP